MGVIEVEQIVKVDLIKIVAANKKLKLDFKKIH